MVLYTFVSSGYVSKCVVSVSERWGFGAHLCAKTLFSVLDHQESLGLRVGAREAKRACFGFRGIQNDLIIESL